VYKIHSLIPSSSLSCFYGQVKLHKPNEPLRSIAASYDSMVNNAESFLKKIISEECTFSLKNTKKFKSKFLEKIDCFDPKMNKVTSVDIQKMYSSINVIRCIAILLKKSVFGPKKIFSVQRPRWQFIATSETRKFQNFFDTNPHKIQYCSKADRNFSTKIRAQYG
jgi:hypothetical protein